MNVLCAAGRRFGLWFYACWLLTGVSQLLGQSSPALIPIQFRVTDSNGVAAVDGPRTLSFRIYTNATGGAAQWVETHRGVVVRDGVAGVMLGSINPALTNVDLAEMRYLGIAVEPASGSGVAAEMVPRTVLLPTVRASAAERARAFPLGTLGSTGFARATIPATAFGSGAAVGNLEGLPLDRIATGALTQIVRDRGYFGADTLLLGTSADNTVLRSAGYVAIAEMPAGGVFLYQKATVPGGFALIPGGPLRIGATSGDVDADAPPVSVTVSAFLIQKTEVTKAQWDEVRVWGSTNGYTDLAVGLGKGTNHPVHSVTWFDCVKWCNAWSDREKLKPVYTIGGTVMKTGTGVPDADWSATGYRLPTEAEWEKAARGGVAGRRFPWGDTISHGEANFRNAGSESYRLGSAGNHPIHGVLPLPYTSPVGSFAANGYGLVDMTGNVREWCWDWYDAAYYTLSRGTSDPRGASGGSRRSFRGGSWESVAANSRTSFRDADPPGTVLNVVGLRPVRTRY